MTTQNETKAYTYLGFAEYQGEDHLYDGNDSPKCEGSVQKVVGYLTDMANQISGRREDDITWTGRNGTWYSGSKAVARLEEEIKALLDDSHFSLNPTKEEIEAAKREESPKVNANPWGHILDMEGCTYHYHENQSALTIKPPQGETLNGGPFKIGLNIGRKIGGCCEMYDAIKFALKYHDMQSGKKDGHPFPSQLANALQKAIDNVDQS